MKKFTNMENLRKTMKHVLDEISMHRYDPEYVRDVLEKFGIAEFIPEEYKNKHEFDKRDVYGILAYLTVASNNPEYLKTLVEEDKTIEILQKAKIDVV